VPKNYLTFISGVLYELDVDQFRLDLKDLEDNEEGMPFPDTHSHKTELTLSGVTYVRSVEIINNYTVEFEDGQYVVRCVGANHNIADVKVANQVSLIIGNSAGYIKIETGVSGLTQDESDQLAAIERVLGLVQENFRMKDQSYDGDGNLTGATIRIYASAADAQNDQNPTDEYSLSASFSGPGVCTAYLMKKVA